MVSTELIEGLGVADAVDAMTMRFQHRAHVIHLDSPDPQRVLFGPAVTISFMPVRKDLMDPEKHSLGPAFCNGHPNTSLGGGTKLSRVRNHKMAGVLCDGQLRDYEELNSYNFAVYCKGETVRAGGNEIQPYLANVPVCVDGVTIVPGDYVFAHGSTAVIIPVDSTESILKKAREIMKKMDSVKDMLANEDPRKVLSQGSSEI